MAGAPEREAVTVLRTARLELRELSTSDLGFVCSMLGDAQVMRHYPAVLDRRGARSWLERQRARYASDGHGLWLVTHGPAGTPVGQVGLLTEQVDGSPVVEVAYLLHRPFRGSGFATEAGAGARDHAIAHLGCDHVVSLIRPVNEPSRAVAHRLGMHLAGRTRHRGFLHDVYRFDAPTQHRTGPCTPG